MANNPGRFMTQRGVSRNALPVSLNNGVSVSFVSVPLVFHEA